MVMLEYDIYLPMAQSDGTAGGSVPLDQIKHSLTDAFGGYTQFTHHGVGLWRLGGVTFRDAVTVVRVLDDGSSKLDMAQFKRNLEELLDQESILIVVRSVSVVGDGE